MSDPHVSQLFSSQTNRGLYMVQEAMGGGDAAVSVVCSGWEECSADYRIERESFPYFALEYIAGGDWEIRFSEGKRRLGPGAVICYGPGVRYSMRPLSDAGLSKYFVDFTGEEMEARLRRIGLPPGSERMVFQHRWLRDLFDQLIDTRRFDAQARERISAMTLDLLLERLPNHFAGEQRKTQAWQSFERCRAYLSEHYARAQSLSSVAEACGVSPAYLSRLFNRFSNESPKAFLDRLKMSRAAQELLRGNVQVKEAAAEAGYEDVFHFSRVFKKRFGLPPSVFANRSGARASSPSGRSTGGA
ncbi:AraC family transcriptional regulator [Pelagicoccus sp. SDUM812003]|uniref:helix-turn-helix domain-containing protein n=1 Tax=Pelagicoccus sp. SDUM812003 TaxID=3041267 RepID=UPI00280E2ACC|nr:AraC family transcriptional regulator [Pelagicoccus sp. SDUM812003]MDQ8202811.1 AraC family transcriptional regulator [Pelagicoccus sp. SDUM812003]